MHATKYSQDLMESAIGEESFKSTKTIYHLTGLAMESSKTFCSTRVRASHAFVLNVVGE